MLFSSTHRYRSSVSKDIFINRLIGKHVKIHDLDFEVFQKNNSLSIIPHAENVDEIKTLPITHVELENKGDKTDVVVTSKMRKVDVGGPQLIVIFCLFLLLAAIVLFYVGGQPQITYTLLGISLLIFTVFVIRLQMGYFDYVRKIRAYIKSRLDSQDIGNARLG
jgi:hypothetical protein